MLLRWLTAPVLLLPVCSMLGCEGRSTTDIVPWSCNEPAPACPLTPEPTGLAGFWRFDDGELGGEWRSAQGTPAPTWRVCDQQGGEWASADWNGECGSERLGGSGASLRLAGSGYVADDLATTPVTVTAWVSLLRSPGRYSVVSVVRSACQSFWLDVVMDDAASLVLSIEKPGPSSDTCEVEESTAQLPSGFFDWGMGNWYPVGAMVNGDDRALFVDGAALDAKVAPGEATTPAATNAVHIGANPAGQSLFKGMIDDVALFDRSLEADELKEFALESTSVLSDGQSWTPFSVSGSSATWQSDCNNPELERTDQGAAIVVKNGYWSAGGLAARTRTGHRIGSLKKAILVANIPDRKDFDFVLGSRHNAERCTWHASGIGKGRYEFSLDDVKHCDCPSTCDCSFSVEEARVSSRWDQSDDLEFSVCRVEFEWGSDEDPIVDLGPGGMRGLNGWCWRPIAYHQEAFVDLDEHLTDKAQTVGTVRGINKTTALMAADFGLGQPGEGRKFCSLEDGTVIRVTADMPAGFEYEFRLADYTGVGLEWTRSWPGGEQTQEFVLCPDEDPPAGVDCGRVENPDRVGNESISRSKIRYLGVQKSYLSTVDTTPITIKSVEFSEGTPEGNCVISSSSGGAGPE